MYTKFKIKAAYSIHAACRPKVLRYIKDIRDDPQFKDIFIRHNISSFAYVMPKSVLPGRAEYFFGVGIFRIFLSKACTMQLKAY